MILAFWICAHAVAQAVVNFYIVSHRLRFIFAIIVASLSGIPLAFQTLILVHELAHMPWKYWVRLPVHRLLIAILGEDGPAASLAAKYYSRKQFGHNYGYAERGGFRMCMAYMTHFLAKLFGCVAFDDTFSGMYNMRNISLAVSLIDECDFQPYDSIGRKVPSKWQYPRNIPRAIPMILTDLELKRNELFKQNDPRQQHENLLTDWVPLEDGKVNWDELFKREENLRWEVLRGLKLMLELFKLENLKVELKRLKQERTIFGQPPYELLDLLSLGREGNAKWNLEEETKAHLTQITQEMRYERSQWPKEQLVEKFGALKERLQRMGENSKLKTLEEVDPEDLKEELTVVDRTIRQVETVERTAEMVRNWIKDTTQFLERWRLLRGWVRGSAWGWEPEEGMQERENLVPREHQVGEGIKLDRELGEDLLYGSSKELDELKRELDHELELEQVLEQEWGLEWVVEQDLELKLERERVLGRGRGRRVELGLGLEQQLLNFLFQMKHLRKIVQEMLFGLELKQLRRMEDGQRWLQQLQKKLGELNERLQMLQEQLERLQEKLTSDLAQPEAELLVITRVVRSVQLQVIFRPYYLKKKIIYFIIATGKEDSFLSKLYLERFRKSCETSNAAELFKLMDILDDNTFFVRRQDENEKGNVLSCERLQTIIHAILEEGKKLDAFRCNTRRSYV